MQLAPFLAWKLRLGSCTGPTLFLGRACSSISAPQRPLILPSTSHSDKVPRVSSGLRFSSTSHNPAGGEEILTFPPTTSTLQMGKPRLGRSTKSRCSERPSRATCPFPWKGDPASPAPAISQQAGTMAPDSPRGARNGRHVGCTWGRWRAAARDPAKSALLLRGPCHLPGPPIRSTLHSPAPCPAALALLFPKPSWRTIRFRRHTRKEVATLAQPLTKTSLPEVPPPRGRMPIGFSFRRSTRFAFSLALGPPTFHSPSFLGSETETHKRELH